MLCCALVHGAGGGEAGGVSCSWVNAALSMQPEANRLARTGYAANSLLITPAAPVRTAIQLRRL